MRHNEQAPKAIYLKDYKQPDFWVESFDMTVKLYDGYTDIVAKTIYKRNGTHKNALTLNGEHMTLQSVQIDGADCKHDVDNKALSIETDKDNFTLVVENRIEPEKNTALEGLYKSGDMYATQCEAHGFRRITYFQDRPDVMTKFTVRIEGDKQKLPILLSNGNLIDTGELPEGRHFTVWEDPHNKPCYLFALVAGDLEVRKDKFKTMSGRNVDLRIYTRKGDLDQTAFAMHCLKKCMAWDEKRFGREYDLDLFNIVAVSDFNMGAMENKSLNIFNTQLILAHPDLATDIDHYRVDAVVAHEYFHNWSGNRVTCRDWFQLSLKEGFTVFREQEYCGDEYGHEIQRIDDVSDLRGRQFAEDAGPMAHPIRPDNYIAIDNFYTSTVYEKGAEVIRMMHTLMGEKTFREACDLYFSRFDGQAVTCDDFVNCMEEVSKIDLAQFRLWYSQAGTPQLTCKGEYDAAKQSYSFTLYQNIPDTAGQKDKKPMHIPVQVGLLNEQGKDLIGTQTLYLRDPVQVFSFEGVKEQPYPSVLRNFSAPVQMDARLDKDTLAFLMANDTNGFNKWEAGQKLALSSILPDIYKAEKDEGFKTDKTFLEAIGTLLETEKSPSLLSRALSLPSQSYISQLREKIDPLAIHKVLAQVEKDIAGTYYDQFLVIYQSNQSTGAYSPDPDSMACRALKNTALNYLMALPEQSTDIAKAQYDNANNMTDRVAALRHLAERETAEKEAAFADFYDRFKKHELVVNKWFSLQTMASRADATEIVKRLTKHEAFTMKNPNRLRSVYSGFAGSNPLGFHQKDGSGYALLKDMLLELDTINPQVTARMMGPFLQWKKLAEPYSSLIKTALEDIAAKDGLSANTFEVVSKALS